VYDAKTQPGRPCYEADEPVGNEPGNFLSAAGALTGGTLSGAAEPPVGAPAALEIPRLGAHPTASPFDYFGAAYVLNMDGDADRMARTAARLGRLGIEYERFAALAAPAGLRPREPNRDAGAYGCAMSHRAILRRALELGRERALIFEDDVVLRDDVEECLRKIVPQLQNLDWDVFYLGLHLEVPGPRRGDNLLEVRRGYHTHAYAVARKAMPRLIAHIDRILAALAGTFDGMEDPSLLKVCAAPILAIQEPNFSRTVGREVDRLDQYFAAFDGEDFRRHCNEMAGWKS